MKQAFTPPLCKALIVSNLVTLCCLAFVAHRYNVWRDVKVRLGFEQPVYADNWAVKGWNNTIEKLDCQRDVVFFGSSSISNSDFRHFFPEVTIANMGYSGDNLKSMARRIPTIRYFQPKAVFITAGFNGLVAQDMEEFRTAYSTFTQMLLDSVPNADIYLQSLLPISKEKEKKTKVSNEKIAKANQEIRAIAEQNPRCTYIDIFSLYYENGELPQALTKDGQHLYPFAYDRWADKIAPYMHKYTIN
jgi:lysophospholipase L1-like esterase